MTDRKLYPDDAAERYKARAGEKYRPSNGHEGELFQGLWCVHCTMDKAHRESHGEEDGCEILAKSYAFEIDESLYPKEWTYGEDGQPTCTAFTDQNPPTEADRKYLEWKAQQARGAA